jgi:hypothetical protein
MVQVRYTGAGVLWVHPRRSLAEVQGVGTPVRFEESEMNDTFEAVMGFICLAAWCAWMWMWAEAAGERGIIETCDNYGSFVYEDVRYTCERVGQ